MVSGVGKILNISAGALCGPTRNFYRAPLRPQGEKTGGPETLRDSESEKQSSRVRPEFPVWRAVIMISRAFS